MHVVYAKLGRVGGWLRRLRYSMFGVRLFRFWFALAAIAKRSRKRPGKKLKFTRQRAEKFIALLFICELGGRDYLLLAERELSFSCGRWTWLFGRLPRLITDEVTYLINVSSQMIDGPRLISEGAANSLTAQKKNIVIDFFGHLPHRAFLSRLPAHCSPKTAAAINHPNGSGQFADVTGHNTTTTHASELLLVPNDCLSTECKLRSCPKRREKPVVLLL